MEAHAILWKTISAIQICLLTTCMGLLVWTVKTVAEHETRITVIENWTTEQRLKRVEELVDHLRMKGVGGA